MLLMALGCQKDNVQPSLPKDSANKLEIDFRHDATTATSAEERAALVAFYQELTSTGTLAWPVDDPASDPCVDSWTGVKCEAGKVISLHPRGKNLQGPVSSQLGDLVRPGML